MKKILIVLLLVFGLSVPVHGQVFVGKTDVYIVETYEVLNEKTGNVDLKKQEPYYWPTKITLDLNNISCPLKFEDTGYNYKICLKLLSIVETSSNDNKEKLTMYANGESTWFELVNFEAKGNYTIIKNQVDEIHLNGKISGGLTIDTFTDQYWVFKGNFNVNLKLISYKPIPIPLQ